MKHQKDRAREESRGAVAVEFALVVPFLLLLVAGIIEFSHALGVQISVTQAAREAARTYAITNDWGKATAAGTAGAPSLSGPISFSHDVDCEPGNTVNVTAEYTANSLTGFALNVSGNLVSFAGSFTSSGVGAMRCGG
ncbi:TadE family protein [Arthrobacter celericrescens]|uniref:TadE family protein n=1 Tax=Arthrobacter celericrescens TaxID=2320851 RepID=UPI000EA000B8|nr:TadE/TadG family type IV pilus assembly protein [Arthrobacter celericrescens]